MLTPSVAPTHETPEMLAANRMSEAFDPLLELILRNIPE